MTYATTGGPGGWGLVAMAVSVLLLAGLALGAYLLLVRHGDPPARRTAARRLGDQFARGDITQREYLHLSATLAASRTSPRRRARGRN